MIQGKKITNKALTCVPDRFKYCYINLVRNTLKNSYSCMDNFKTKILKHITKIIYNLNLKQQEKICSCRKEKCPLDNNN